MSSGTEFSIDLGVVGSAAYVSAAAATAALADKLTAAGLAAVAASDAVKAGENAYRQAERAAEGAAKALERIGLAAEAQRGKMKAAMDAGDAASFWRAAAAAEKLNVRQTEATAKATAAAAAVKAEAAALDQLKASASSASDAEKKIAAAHEAAKKAADATNKATSSASGSGKVNEMAEAFGRLGGPLGSLGQKVFGAADGFKKLTGSLGAAAGAYALVAIAVIAVTGALIAGTIALAHFAIANADAARTSSLLSAGIAQSVVGGELLDKTIHDLGSQVPQTREELLSMAAGLAKTGLRGAELSAALEDAAVKAARLKYGPDFARQTLSLTSQAARLKDHISGPQGIFSGLHIEGLLSGLAKIVDLFDATSTTGKAIKVVFESIFQPLVDGLAGLVPKFVKTFIQFEIWAMKAAIAIKPWGSTIVTVGKVVGVALLVVVAGVAAVAAVMIGMAAVAGALVVGLGYLGVKFTELLFGAQGLGRAILAGPGAAFDWLKAKAASIVDFLSSLNLAEVGMQIVTGLASGILGGGSTVLSAITGVVGGAIEGAKKLLGIASPSKVFAEIGADTGAGMAGGVEASTGAVQGSLESMVAPPEAQPTASPATAAKSGSSVNLAGATFIFQGVEGAEDAEGRFGALLTRLIEGDVAQLGSEVPA